MAWNTTKFETHMRAKLEGQLGGEKATEMYSAYTVARTKLVENVFNEFKAVEPQLSDHGPDHIANVLNNAYFLLAPSGLDYLTGIELYLLGMMILFHDVGNTYGRKDHHKKVAEIFDWARGADPSVKREKTLVLNATRAHTGRAPDGTFDTLAALGPSDHLGNEPVRLQQLAAVLRFADELAEGVQRTSEFMLLKGMYAAESQIYHEYASVTNVSIDRGNERVLLTYEIDLKEPSEDAAWRKWISDLLEFVYTRAVKLDQERRYARYYSDVLNPFKATWIKINFTCHGQLLDFPPPVKLDDKVIPGDNTKPFSEVHPPYHVDALLNAILAKAKEVAP